MTLVRYRHDCSAVRDYSGALLDITQEQDEGDTVWEELIEGTAEDHGGECGSRETRSYERGDTGERIRPVVEEEQGHSRYSRSRTFPSAISQE
jgi:hypothetical protein